MIMHLLWRWGFGAIWRKRGHGGISRHGWNGGIIGHHLPDHFAVESPAFLLLEAQEGSAGLVTR